jgi:4-aminobutyrate aminotransferase
MTATASTNQPTAHDGRHAAADARPSWLSADRPVPDIRTELPGPLSRAVLEKDTAITSPSLPRAYPLVPQRGEGCVIEDADGNLFLDFNAGIAVNSTGHCHPRVVEAVQRQAETLLHYSASDFFLPIYSEMCSALAATAPMDEPVRVFLSNSGAEAVEGALKLARYATGRPYVISFFGAFHGRTYGAVTLTASKAKYHQGFGPLLPGVLHAPYAFNGRDAVTGAPVHDEDATFDYLENVLFRYQVTPTEVAAIFVEPIQGEGGYIVPPAAWMARLRELCDKYGILLVADEVQSGAGRTGKMWAIEHLGVQPDVLISAKGLASGLPLGAFMARKTLMESWKPGAHGSTYGGSPIPCAAGLATLEVIHEEGLLANADTIGRQLMTGLRELQQKFPEQIVDVRGLGLMIGVEFRTAEQANAVQQRAFERGLLVLECGETSIRMSPPLVVNAAQAQTALELFGAALAG